MNWYKDHLQVNTRGKGLYSITKLVQQRLQEWGVREGLCTLFLQHTSASLVLNENYDPSAREDLETFMEQLVPEDQPWHVHHLEGPDDSPSHMRAMLTLPSVTIPVENGRLALGTWQGIFLFEHRVESQARSILIRCLSVD